MSLALHYWMGDVHHCSGTPVSETTYTVSSGTLNPSIPHLMGYPHQGMSCTACCSGCFRRSEAAISSIIRVLFSVSPALVEFLLLLCLESDILFLCFIAWCKWLQVWTEKLMDDMLWCWRPQNKWRATYSFQSAVWSHLHNLHGLPSQCTNWFEAPCGLRGCKNRPAPFHGRMS